jgi:alpha,alpha-trehalase
MKNKVLQKRQKTNFRYFSSFLFCLFLFSCGENVKKKTFEDPQEKWSPFYEEVLKQKLVENEKIWADAVPNATKDEILAYYKNEKLQTNFSLKAFIDSAFTINTTKKNTANLEKITFESYLKNEFLDLKTKMKDDGGSMLPTRKDVITGGSKFQEFGYAQSYFVYKGLEALGREDLCENLILNFLQFVQDYGHVPASNRTYKLESSELPVLVLLIDAHCKKHPEKLAEFSSLLTKEYQYWIAAENAEETKNQNAAKKTGAYRNVVFIGQNDILGRYYSADSSRRADKYMQDAGISKATLANLRANDMTGYNIAGRWKAEETSQILPIDLNALLYKMETLLAKAYELKKRSTYAESFKNLAAKRKAIYNATFWKNDFYYDYNFNQKSSARTISLAALWPLLSDLADKKQTDLVLKTIESKLGNQGLFQNSEKDTTISIELNYLAYLVALKSGESTLSQKLRKNLQEFAKGKFEKEGEIRANYGLENNVERVDGALGALIGLGKE